MGALSNVPSVEVSAVLGIISINFNASLNGAHWKLAGHNRSIIRINAYLKACSFLYISSLYSLGYNNPCNS
jgi:hypothetical protein